MRKKRSVFVYSEVYSILTVWRPITAGMSIQGVLDWCKFSRLEQKEKLHDQDKTSLDFLLITPNLIEPKSQTFLLKWAWHSVGGLDLETVKVLAVLRRI